MLQFQKIHALKLGLVAILGLVLISLFLSRGDGSTSAARGAVAAEARSDAESPSSTLTTSTEDESSGVHRESVTEGLLSTKRHLVILVVDPKGGPAPDSRITLHSRGARATGLGSTGPLGKLSVPSSVLGRGVLEARHDGFAPAVLELTDEPPDSIELRLGESASIEGLLSWADGGSPRPGAEVVAFPRSQLPFVVDDESWRADVLGMHRARRVSSWWPASRY